MSSAVPTQTIRYDYTVNVNTNAYVQLDASIDNQNHEIQIFDSSGRTMKLAIGASGSEQDILMYQPGGIERQKLYLPKGVRLAIRAVSANATAGEVLIQLWG